MHFDELFYICLRIFTHSALINTTNTHERQKSVMYLILDNLIILNVNFVILGISRREQSNQNESHPKQ